jgi:hypothetical protein
VWIAGVANSSPAGGFHRGGDRYLLPPAGQVQFWEQVKNPVLIDELNPLTVQPHKMGAVLPVAFPDALIHAKQVRVGAINTFAQGNADFRHREMAGTANGENVLADDVMFAFPQAGVVFDEAKNPASHENVGMCVVIGLDLLETLIHPIDTVSTIDHCEIKKPRV